MNTVVLKNSKINITITMTDSKVYSSLFALVDSHLSKTSVQDNREDTGNQTIKNNPFNNVLESNSETSLLSQPPRRFPISPFDTSESPIVNVLAQQVTNMLKAKEIKKQKQEKLKLEEELKQLQIEEQNSTVIDLMKAIQTPYKPNFISHDEETLSNSSSCESLFKLNFKDCDDDEPEKTKTPEPLLPCTTDMSYILKQKFKRNKASSFGRVVTSRLRPVAAPYLRQIYPTRIIRFAFNTPSPCDVIKERLRRPTMSTTYTINNLEDFQ
ncbi:uncharacterized protein LOC113401086 [Vanessa tameamea]|uniref:Uncharacterized protein LOC113401086 n=1 Tax=Vanessa tameamea TaxID=334116 RepID=A0A8B8IHN0_VANTA|nr:uncharacterized protein LOC113401086 [Vanessa tameamea]